MQILGTEKKLCVCCMEEHEVKTVLIHDRLTFMDTDVSFDTVCMYCDVADEFYANEEQIRANNIRLKDGYRKQKGLLTSSDIQAIRAKYGITQSDLCTLLGWDNDTITGYESYQVQDKIHDFILKRIGSDPEWVLALLAEAQEKFPRDVYIRYRNNAAELCEDKHVIYDASQPASTDLQVSGQHKKHK